MNVLIVFIFSLGLFISQAAYSYESWNSEDLQMTITCNSQNYKLYSADGVGAAHIASSKTDRGTAIGAGGQGGLYEWACVFIDNVPYLWFRGDDAMEYIEPKIIVGKEPDYGYVRLHHVIYQLNELDWGVSQQHRQKK